MDQQNLFKMTGTVPIKLDGANVRDLSAAVKSGYSALPINDKLAHRDRQRPMMALSLGFGWTKEADHSLRIKGQGLSTQGPFSQAGFLRPFCWRHPKQCDRANTFIQALGGASDTIGGEDESLSLMRALRGSLA